MSGQARSLVLVLAAALSGCGGASSSTAPQTAETTSGATSSAPSAIPSAASSPPATSVVASPSAGSTAVLTTEGVAITLESDLRMRSKPEVSATSALYSPMLPRGAELFVVGGPVHESGYDWYEVLPLDSGLPSRGWVASGSRLGEPWIAPASPTCQASPTTITGLDGMTGGMSLACFSGVPITLEARLLPCGCEVDPAYDWKPAWFGDTTLVLAAPAAAAPPREPWLFLNLDPSGTYPHPLPVGDTVEVTGMFDHPAARGCTATLEQEPEVLHDVCRTSFAVTSLR